MANLQNTNSKNTNILDNFYDLSDLAGHLMTKQSGKVEALGVTDLQQVFQTGTLGKFVIERVPIMDQWTTTISARGGKKYVVGMSMAIHTGKPKFYKTIHAAIADLEKIGYEINALNG